MPAVHACATFREFRLTGSSSIMHTKTLRNPRDLDIQYACRRCQVYVDAKFQ